MSIADDNTDLVSQAAEYFAAATIKAFESCNPKALAIVSEAAALVMAYLVDGKEVVADWDAWTEAVPYDTATDIRATVAVYSVAGLIEEAMELQDTDEIVDDWAAIIDEAQDVLENAELHL